MSVDEITVSPAVADSRPWWEPRPWGESGPDKSEEDVLAWVPGWGWRPAYSFEGGPWTFNDDCPDVVQTATYWMPVPPDPDEEEL